MQVMHDTVFYSFIFKIHCDKLFKYYLTHYTM